MVEKKLLDAKIVKTGGTQSFVHQRDVFDLQDYIIQVVSVPPASASGDNFANADLLLTGTRLHSGGTNSIAFDNFNEWLVYTDGNYIIENNNSGIQLFNGIEPFLSIPMAAVRKSTDADNYALLMIADIGGNPLTGITQLSNGGTASERKDSILVEADRIDLFHKAFFTGTDYFIAELSLGDGFSKLSRSNFDGTLYESSFQIDEFNFKFENSLNAGFTMPYTTPTAKYQTLVSGSTNKDLEWQPTVPSYILTTPVQLPGQYLGSDHYRVTVTVSSLGSGGVVATLPVGATPYQIYGYQTNGANTILPYAKVAGDYIQFEYNVIAQEVRLVTNLSIDAEITIHYKA